MLNVPETVKTLFMRDGVRKNFRVHFPNNELPDITNANVVQESVKFTESLCSQDVLKFGLTEASVIEFETVGIGNMYGMYIDCGIEIDLSSLSAADISAIAAGTWDGIYCAVGDSDIGYAYFRIPYGRFRVEKCPRDHQAMTHRKVTGYTVGIKDYDTFPEFPAKAYWESVDIDINSIIAKSFGTGLTEYCPGEARTGYYDPMEHFYGPNGESIALYLSNSNGGYPLTKALIANYNDDYAVSFFEYSSDSQEYPKLLANIMQALTTGGYDIRYNQNGQQIYATISDALKDKTPQFYKPCLYYVWYDKGNLFCGEKQPINANTLIPIISGPQRAGSAAFVANYSNALYWRAYFLYLPQWHNCNLVIYKNNTLDSIIQISQSSDIPTNVSWKSYRLTNYSIRQTVKSTSNKKVTLWDQTSTISNQFNEYSYADAYSYLDSLNGALELSAQFAAVDRSGGNKLVRINRNSPVSIIPGQYSNMWFDEYDVNPIGTVKFCYTDEAREEQIVNYQFDQFGGNGSVYDMTDNDILKTMDGMRPAVIESMLDSSFIPNLGSINFTPIDLTMKGLPYIEAGDALSVMAQDETVCSSYALRQEISGIQDLETQISSENGQIIDNGGT